MAVLRRVGPRAAEVGGMAVVGPDQPDLEVDVREPHDTHPDGGHQEMRIDPLVVHVLEAVLGQIVLHPHPRLLRSHPVGAPAGERLVRTRLAQDARIELRADPVLMGVGGAPDHLAGGDPVGGQLGQARSKGRIDVSLQDFSGRVDVRIGVPRAETGLHGLLLLSVCTLVPECARFEGLSLPLMGGRGSVRHPWICHPSARGAE